MDHFNHLYRKQFFIRNPETFPEVDTTLFKQSANQSQLLINQAQIICRAIASDDNFAHTLMDAAQRSQTNKVKELIQGIGVDKPLDTTFNPDGIRITIYASSNKDTNVSLALRWR